MIKLWHILAAAAAVSLLLGLGGYVYYTQEYNSITQSREYEIATIGALKIRQIEQWHKEKLGDVRVVTQSAFFRRAIDEWLAKVNDTTLQSAIRKRLVHPQIEFGFENIFFLAPDGSLLLSLDTAATAVCPSTIVKVRAAAESTHVTSTDFYFCTTHRKVHYDFVAPIRDRKNRLLAALVFRLDPGEYLYPLIESWPTPSRTAETLLLRRMQDSVVVLNELRQHANSALRLALPMERTDNAAVQAALGYRGIYMGRDYHGETVLAYLGAIPGTHWLLVAQEDASEIFSDLYYRSTMTLILTLALILLVLSGSAFFYNVRQKNLYYVLFEKERQLHEQLEERKKLEAQLFRSQRSESIGTLAAGIAHDFNNILNVIVGNAELLASAPSDTEKTQRRVNAIIKASERGTHVVRQLLAVARKTDIQRLPVNVNDLILEVSKLLFETFPKTITVVTDLMPEAPSVDGDADQLHQVLLNLSVNARDAMPGGGTLTFRTTRVPEGRLRALFPAARAEDYIRLTVIDTGEGMSEETRKQIFDPFFTTKGQGKGTGLGLAVAQGIIESHAGFIDVQSEKGKGTCFDVYLPAVAQSAAAEAPEAPVRLPVEEGHETLLYIEDEESILDLAVEFLESHGYRVLTAVNGEQGVEVFMKNRERISLVVSDFGLPKFDGEEVFKRIRRIDPQMPFAILTGFMPPEKRQELLARGVSDILSKPHAPAELLAMIRRVLEANRQATS